MIYVAHHIVVFAQSSSAASGSSADQGMNLLNVIVLAILQGVTELFPISSLGHTVIIPGLLGWGDLLSGSNFLPLVVMLHIGTSVALLSFFWRDWLKLLGGGLRVLKAARITPDVDPGGHGRILALVIVGSIPAGLIGVAFQKQLENNFKDPIIAAAFLVVNGAVLLTAERYARNQRKNAARLANVRGKISGAPAGGKAITELSFMQAAVIGFAQSFALIPGISRSGATMAAGMANGLDHEESARFSFLMAAPIILAAGIAEIPKLLHNQTMHALELAAIGGVISGIAAYLSVKFLMKYFETNRLDPFAYYCAIVGLLAFGYFFYQALPLLQF